MRLDRRTQPRVYQRVAIRTTVLDEERRRAAAFWDVAIGVFGLAFVVFLFGILG